MRLERAQQPNQSAAVDPRDAATAISSPKHLCVRVSNTDIVAAVPKSTSRAALARVSLDLGAITASYSTGAASASHRPTRKMTALLLICLVIETTRSLCFKLEPLLRFQLKAQ